MPLPRNIGDLIDYIESKYSVENIAYGNLQLWPFIRHEVFSIYEAKSFRNDNKNVFFQTKLFSYLSYVFPLTRAFLFSWWPFLFKKHAPLLLTDYGELAEIRFVDGKPIDRIAGYLVEIQKDIIPVAIRKKKKSPFKKYINPLIFSLLFRFEKISFDENRLYGEETLANLCKELEIEYGLKKTSRRILKQISFYEKWLNFAKPSVVYCICYYSLEKITLYYVAKKMGIPVIEFQHGTLGHNHLAYHGLKEFKENPFPNYFFSYGHGWKERISPAIYNSDNIKIIGNYYYDILLDGVDKNRGLFYEAHPCLNGKKVITFASQVVLEKECFEFAKKILDLCSDLYILYVPRFKKDFLASKDERLIVEYNLDVYQCMMNSCVTITPFSTCAQESLIFGVPVIVFDYMGIATAHISELIKGMQSYAVVDKAECFLESFNRLLNLDKSIVKEEVRAFFEPGHKNLLEQALREIGVME